MLFLAITSALFVSTYLMMQGQQPRAQFAQGMRDIESKFRDYINDVSTGYYPQVGEFSCSASPTGVSFSSTGGGDTTGTNLDCIFLGKALQVDALDEPDAIYAYSVVGRRRIETAGFKRDVSNYSEAIPRAVYDTSEGLDKTERFEIPWGVKVKSVHVNSAPIDNGSDRMIAIYSSLSRTSTVTPGQSESGALVLQPFTYDLPSGSTKDTAIQCINTTDACGRSVDDFENWQLCFERADGKETALLTIGGDGKKTNITMEFKDCA